MTKFFVTVGTGSFDGLVEIFDHSSLDCFIQYGTGSKPRNKPSCKFIEDDFVGIASKHDYVVTHCGAGTIYTLLGENIKLVTIPNIERKDQHQIELFNYLNFNRFCFGLSLESLSKSIESLSGQIREYESLGGFQKYHIPFFNVEPLINP